MRARPTAPRLAWSAEDGFMLIEMLVSLTVLLVGIGGLMMGMATSAKLSQVSERHGSMTQIAQREIERIEGLAYAQIGLDCGGSSGNQCPAPSTQPMNPDYYVGSGGTTFQRNSTSGTSETLDIDPTNGTVVPVQSWSESTNGGELSGSIYDFVTQATDAAAPGGTSSACSPGCPSSSDYKRITVAVTMSAGEAPTPVWVATVMVDPNAAPASGTVNGTAGNPINSPSVTCQNGAVSGPCTAGLASGSANTFFLHDWAATSSGLPQTPSADNLTHATVGSTGLCTALVALATILANIAGCPVPDLMDANPPSGSSSTALYNYSTDQCPDSSGCYPGGRELRALGAGTDSTGDCTVSAWTTTLGNQANQMWMTPPLSAAMTLTGAGGLSLYTQTLDPTPSPAPLVSFCVELYAVPPSGTAGSLSDLFAWSPTALGGAAYVAPTNPTTGGNWPASASQLAFEFTFAQQAVTVPAGDRIGLRVWIKSEPAPSAPIDLIYDNPNYSAQLQLNSQ